MNLAISTILFVKIAIFFLLHAGIGFLIIFLWNAVILSFASRVPESWKGGRGKRYKICGFQFK